jgi:hypothetical protein
MCPAVLLMKYISADSNLLSLVLIDHDSLPYKNVDLVVLQIHVLVCLDSNGGLKI